MDAAQMLHTFARRTCMNRHAHWVAVYGALVREGRERIDSGGYTDEAYAVFPRYNVLQTVLDHIEALNADALPGFEQLRALLVDAAETATSDLTEPMASAIHQGAMAEERASLASVFRVVSEPELVGIEPLFYRRALSSHEVQTWRQVIKQAWGAPDGYWYPLGEKSHPSLVALELYGIDGAAFQDRIRRFLAENFVGRVIELREYGTSYEVQSDAAELFYNGLKDFGRQIEPSGSSIAPTKGR